MAVAVKLAKQQIVTVDSMQEYEHIQRPLISFFIHIVFVLHCKSHTSKVLQCLRAYQIAKLTK